MTTLTLPVSTRPIPRSLALFGWCRVEGLSCRSTWLALRRRVSCRKASDNDRQSLGGPFALDDHVWKDCTEQGFHVSPRADGPHEDRFTRRNTGPVDGVDGHPSTDAPEPLHQGTICVRHADADMPTGPADVDMALSVNNASQVGSLVAGAHPDDIGWFGFLVARDQRHRVPNVLTPIGSSEYTDRGALTASAFANADRNVRWSALAPVLASTCVALQELRHLVLVSRIRLVHMSAASAQAQGGCHLLNFSRWQCHNQW